MSTYAPTFCVLILLASTAVGQTTETRYLSGTGNDDTVDWEFRINGGRRSGQWETIPVPSNWEMQGFGTYRYYDDWSEDPAPDRTGEYRLRFDAPALWEGRRVDIVFGGVMTDTEVKINGRVAGPVHQGGFYEFRYDVTDLLEFGGANILDVVVQKYSANRSVNRAERQADYWLFGGVYRPVWLDVLPSQHIDRIAIDARHTGDFSADIHLDGVTAADRVTAQIHDLDGVAVGAPFAAQVASGDSLVALRSRADDVQAWSAEWPNRYRVTVRLQQGDTVIHEIAETFGFRTVEVRPHDGVYVNGTKVRLRGVNRHTFWPTSGRATSPALSVQDVHLMKDMNMNAVRMSHYPPDTHFLDAADALGLYVIDELAGWQAAYDTEAGAKLVAEMIARDVNHPSILFWANGNEGGWNTELDDDFAQYDPQRRTVIHPWLNFNGINTSHYEVYDCCAGSFFHGKDIFMPTELLHGLYDGGGGAGLDDWWNLMVDHPLAVGLFLWAFADEGIVRDDQDGRIDVAGNRAPDGVVGPYREKEGSFFTIKEVWSPVYLPLSESDTLPPTFSGTLQVENRYDFTDLSHVSFIWAIVDFAGPGSGATGHTVFAEGVSGPPPVPPRGVGTLAIDLPEEWPSHDALFLTATDPHGRAIYTWTWMIQKPKAVAERHISRGTGRVTGSTADGMVTMKAGGTEIRIDAASGLLHGVRHNGTEIPLRNGPRPVSGETSLTNIVHHAEGDDYVVRARFDGVLRHVEWRLLPGGWLRLDYDYRHPADADINYLGVTFDYPDDRVDGLRWLGKGPYRVWKNRLKGAEFDVWEKKYNDAITGDRWVYPEFKGFHDDVYWARLDTKDGPVTMVMASDDLFLRVFTPAEADQPRTTHVDFPPGDLSFMHGIAPIGTKFHTASEHGPAGQPYRVRRHGQTFTGTVYFHFGDRDANALSSRHRRPASSR